MKILLINNFHYRKGGSEAVYFNTARLLRENGHEVVCFSQKDALNERCPEEGFFFEGKGGKLSSAVKYFYNRDAAVQLENLLNTFTPDIAHIHLMWGCSASAVLQVLRKHHIPIVHTAHDYRMVCPAYVFKTTDGSICERCHNCNYWPCLMNKCSKGSFVQSAVMVAEMYARHLFYDPVRMIDGFIFVSAFSESKHIQHDPRFADVRRIVLYNSTDRKTVGHVADRNGYVYFGRLSKEKGLFTLIEAFRQRPGLKLRIIGSGPLEEELRKSLPANVSLCGYMTGDALYSSIASAKFAIIPSECYENNPMTIIEAYSLSVPVIGSNIGGIPEIVADGVTGFLFNPFDVDSMVEAIDRAESLSDDDIASFSANAFDFYLKNFDGEACYQHLVNFYKSVVKKCKI